MPAIPRRGYWNGWEGVAVLSGCFVGEGSGLRKGCALTGTNDVNEARMTHVRKRASNVPHSYVGCAGTGGSLAQV